MLTSLTDNAPKVNARSQIVTLRRRRSVNLL